ncbi:MAG: hypothetical protein IPP43_14155 [Chitinophagaceae bacterium]|nr:hypothetical protein [Chitinophagaceae bacterium]
MSETKIRLSQKEMELVTNADLILTKNVILEKVNQLLADLQLKQQMYVTSQAPGIPAEFTHSSSKISKGENYQGLPYRLLDYPKIFDHANILAIRTMFWWGNFFSITLHISGNFKQEAAEKLIAAYPALKENKYYACRNKDPWEHHFENGNYVLISELSENEFEELVRGKDFFKLVNKLPLLQWNESEEILLAYFKQMIRLLADQPPSR